MPEGNKSIVVDAAGIHGKRMLLPGEILFQRNRKSAEAIVGEANPDSMNPVLVVSETGEASSEGLNIKQREILNPFINAEAEQWMLM
jgi:hypothetical protein